jgi:hypothetical protein
MATILSLRTTYLNTYLDRNEGSTRPWTDAECSQFLTDALYATWPDMGHFTYAESPASGTQFIPVPATFTAALDYKLSRVILLDAPQAQGGTYTDDVKGYRKHSATTIVSKKVIPQAGQYVGFYGFIPIAADGSTLPLRMESTISNLAASYAYGKLAAELLNSERQQNLDSGRVVDYASAAGFSSYWLRLYEARTVVEPLRLSYAPRASSRT